MTLSALIRRMERPGDFLAQCQLIGGLASSMFFVLPALAFAAVPIGWSAFNVWLKGKYPDHVPAAAPLPAA